MTTNNKSIFVTGAGRGIGQAISIALAKEGYTVFGSARSIDQLQETQKQAGPRFQFQPLDVRSEESLQQWMSSSCKNSSCEPWGLVTAAGIYGPIGPFVSNDSKMWQEWKEGLEINLYGSALAAKVFASTLIQRKLPGRVVLLSGGGATQPMENFTSYCASKAAVVRFGETLALELKPHQIDVNSLAPGAVNTTLTEEVVKAGPEKSGKQFYEKTVAQLEKGGAGTEPACRLVSYLMSPQAKGITGKLISAVWDPWARFHDLRDLVDHRDNLTLRRLVPPELSGP